MKTKNNKSSKHGKGKINRKQTNTKHTKKKKVLIRQLQENEKPRIKPSRGSYKYSSKKLQGLSLRERMLEKLKSSRFRYINEQLYSMKGKDALNYFKRDKDAFSAYHSGYKQQVQQWPINPTDVILKALKNVIKKGQVIADFGCGEAMIAKSLPDIKVHSFDLVSLDPCVTECDMASTPLQDSSVDIAVFCLSLMGTNFSDYLIEANRVLKDGGVLKIAEIESRFEDGEYFITSMSKFGFVNTSNNFTHQLFYFMDFRKERNLGKNCKKKLSDLVLKPCLYKKR